MVKALWIKGNVYDSNVDYLKGKGLNITQEANGVMYYDYSPYLHKFYLLMQTETLKLALLLNPLKWKVQ